MATVENKKGSSKGNQQAKGAEKLPKPPKSWIAKRLDNAKRVLRNAAPLFERIAPAGVEARPEFQRAKVAYDFAKMLHSNAEQLVKELAGLEALNYVPAGAEAGVKLAPGLKVWVRGQVWRAKYVGLYQPAELEGLAIVTINGKKALAKSATGISVVEPVGAFTTRAVDYAAESHEAA